MSSYATITDLQRYGLPPEAIQGIADPTLQAELDAASTLADSYLRGRYALPLISYDVELTMNVCWLAAFNIMAARGYNPEQGADSIYLDRFNRATAWLRGVQRQEIHPNVQPQPVDDATLGFPQVSTAPARGWGDCGPSGRNGGVW